MKKNIIIVIVLIAVGIFIYYGFVKDVPSGGNSLLNTQSSATSGVLGKDISNALGKIGAINLDTSIFSDSSFLILRNYKQRIAPQQPFRPNPFLPVTAPDPDIGGPQVSGLLTPNTEGDDEEVNEDVSASEDGEASDSNEGEATSTTGAAGAGTSTSASTSTENSSTPTAGSQTQTTPQ